MKTTYILVYYFHDTNINYYSTLNAMKVGLEKLKEEYKNYSEFSYECFVAVDVTKAYE